MEAALSICTPIILFKLQLTMPDCNHFLDTHHIEQVIHPSVSRV